MKTNPNDPAFVNPVVMGYIQESGKPETRQEINSRPLSKKEFFAAICLQGMLANHESRNLSIFSITEAAVEYADMLIKKLNLDTTKIAPPPHKP